MRDVELYRYLLGIEPPWSVSEVKLNVKHGTVDVWVDHPDGDPMECPECGGMAPVYDHAPERVWRHLDSCQFKTLLHASIPRVECSKDGVLQIHVPWAEPKSRFTLLFERLAIDMLQECSVQGAAKILGLTWDEAEGILARAVQRGLAAKEERTHEYLGVDEKSFRKRHRYITLVCDLRRGTVEYVGDDRKQSTLGQYYEGLSELQVDAIKGVAMDMWEPFVQATLAGVPGADSKIVFDRYHIMQHMGQAVDKVRKQEHQSLGGAGRSPLTGSKYLWLYAEENLPEKHREKFEALKAGNLKTGRAWAIKESLRELWNEQTRQGAERYWKRWYFWATHSRLDPVRKVAAMIKSHLSNVLTYFEHKITNATSEGLNSKIQTIKQRAYGFRNRDNFKRAIYFHCGGLSLYPTHGVSG